MSYPGYDMYKFLTSGVPMLLKKLISVLFAIVCLTMSASSVALPKDATMIDQIVVFGDSLSDNGNTWNYTYYWHKIDPWNVEITPKSPPYYEGRFSNGPVWVEDLAKTMNVKLLDWAYGGSLVERISNLLPDLGWQVTEYYHLNSDNNMGQHLFVIWDGANDYMHDPNTPDGTVDNTVNIIKANVEYLISAGAKNIVLIGLPDFSKVPGIVAHGPDFAAQKGALAAEHNQKLFAMVEHEQQLNPGVKIIGIDIKDYFNDITTNPAKYHLQNVTDPCYGGGFSLRTQLLQSWETQHNVSAPLDIRNNMQLQEAYLVGQLHDNDVNKCDNEDAYLYWDKVHPTRVVHQIIATVALQILNENGIFGNS